MMFFLYTLARKFGAHFGTGLFGFRVARYGDFGVGPMASVLSEIA